MRRWHFRFEECWTLHQECGDIVRNNGNWKTSGDSFSPLHKIFSLVPRSLEGGGKIFYQTENIKLRNAKLLFKMPIVSFQRWTSLKSMPLSLS